MCAFPLHRVGASALSQAMAAFVEKAKEKDDQLLATESYDLFLLACQICQGTKKERELNDFFFDVGEINGSKCAETLLLNFFEYSNKTNVVNYFDALRLFQILYQHPYFQAHFQIETFRNQFFLTTIDQILNSEKNPISISRPAWGTLESGILETLFKQKLLPSQATFQDALTRLFKFNTKENELPYLAILETIFTHAPESYLTGFIEPLFQTVLDQEQQLKPSSLETLSKKSLTILKQLFSRQLLSDAFLDHNFKKEELATGLDLFDLGFHSHILVDSALHWI